MSNSKEEYQGLLFDDGSLENDNSIIESSADADASAKDVSGLSSLAKWIVSALLVICFTDVVGFLYLVRSFATVYQDPHYATNLEYADSYIGLKELYASGRINSSAIDPIFVRPRVSAQVYEDDPDNLTPLGERDYWRDGFGRASPHERRLYVTPTTRTVVQFRAIDFGMEECELVFTLPTPGEPLERGAFFSIDPTSRFDVFRLDADRPIDVQKLSFRSRPKISERVARNIALRVGEDTQVHRFGCPATSLHVFEVACAAGTECMLDTWSSQNTTFGANMYQYQTV
ncbi:uncharacterized protein BXZ73DRAFT_106618 [Epithele typhae]|uniref:uncharacterized protein n=1 Tax=Epithele typhae TaxID=378194 RepID=UPI0020083BA4|nr:uncharacterized protein BXZ73DRAFT_106618 [Epithele typhae]KAH9914376.1 hypothetical protein BXZ73DRAFT_106618 [Epithele typhae]